MFEGSIATNVKYAAVTNPLYLDFASTWGNMYDNNEINLIPWEGETNVLSVMPYTAQTCNAFFAECTVPFAPWDDAIAILAQAATNWVNNGGTGAITRQNLIDEMKSDTLSTPGIGNVDDNNLFKFDTELGGYDGFRSCNRYLLVVTFRLCFQY